MLRGCVHGRVPYVSKPSLDQALFDRFLLRARPVNREVRRSGFKLRVSMGCSNLGGEVR